MSCELCTEHHAREIWRCKEAYVIDASEAELPCFIRIVSTRHAAEMTDLPEHEQSLIFSLVLAAESAMRRTAAPDKVNLASLGNMVAHVHWHVIGRWRDDAFFPNSIWSSRLRTTPPEVLAQRREKNAELLRILPEVLSNVLKEH